MSLQNRLTKLLHIEKPIIQAGMIWNSGWRLASQVSLAGGLGLIGGGSMYPTIFREHLQKCRLALHNTNRTQFGVNIPLVMPNIDEYMKIIIEEKVPIVFTSAGNPHTWTKELKKHNIIVVHVISSSKFAMKAQEAGCDAVVAEGFEAGGHNGREETTSLVLIPGVTSVIKDIPVIAAGGIYSGKSMLAAMILGADGVQIGSRFVASDEASSHTKFKEAVITSTEGYHTHCETHLVMKQLQPVRLLKNDFYKQVIEAEMRGCTKQEMMVLLGRARSKLGMFEGDLANGELEIGQVSGLINKIMPAKDIMEEIWQEFLIAYQQPLPTSNINL